MFNRIGETIMETKQDATVFLDVDSQGRVTIPKTIRTVLNIKPKAVVEVKISLVRQAEPL